MTIQLGFGFIRDSLPPPPLVTHTEKTVEFQTSAMPALRKRNRLSEFDAISNHDTPHEQKKNMSEYELSREQRIRENRERMGKLGILDLSLTLKLNNKNKRSYSSHKPQTPPSLPNSSVPVRRSSRFFSDQSQCTFLFIFALKIRIVFLGCRM